VLTKTEGGDMKTLTNKVQVLFLICLTMMTMWHYNKISQTTRPNLNLQISQFTKEARGEIYCLAENIYFEAGHEPTLGKYAVAFVTQNRVNSGKFADSICGVVKQKIGSTCQFSWWCEDKSKFISTNNLLTNSMNPVYNEALRLAIHFYTNHDNLKDPTNGALFYHADYVNPNWSFAKKEITIGRHIFYNYKRNPNERL
jgi:spore germination cell wall hydrolase CwlJ-like protein